MTTSFISDPMFFSMKRHEEKMLNNSFYIDFENRFRGCRDSVTQSLLVYLPITEFLRNFYPNSVALDLGCGRGEWLELQTKQGWNVVGVDTNDAMIKQCQEFNFNVLQADAYEYLKKSESNSIALITGFHILEHCDLETQLGILQESKRVLLPGGIIIFETPNPENILVGTCNFYTDPTHKKPIPPHLLSYMSEISGYYKHIILRLRGVDFDVNDLPNNMLTQLLTAYADYALIAQKQTSKSSILLGNVFNVVKDLYRVELNSFVSILSALDLERNNNNIRLRHLENEVYHSMYYRFARKYNHTKEKIGVKVITCKHALLKLFILFFRIIWIFLKNPFKIVLSNPSIYNGSKDILYKFPCVYKMLHFVFVRLRNFKTQQNSSNAPCAAQELPQPALKYFNILCRAFKK